MVMLAADQVVPTLRAHHHLAGGALVVQGLRDARSLGLGDAVVVGESRLAGLGLHDECAECGALGFNGFDGGVIARDEGDAAGALGGEFRSGIGERSGAGRAQGLLLVGAFE